MTDTKIKIMAHVVEIMKELKIVQGPGNVDTPKRIAKMLSDELFRNVNRPIGELDSQMTTFEKSDLIIEPVTIKNIKFTSTCEHHWLPFTGFADIEYVPGNSILGLSKFPRVVKWFSKMPQTQEKLTQDIGKYLSNYLRPIYLKVVLHDVHHSCVSARGIESECTTDTTFEYTPISLH